MTSVLFVPSVLCILFKIDSNHGESFRDKKDKKDGKDNKDRSQWRTVEA